MKPTQQSLNILFFVLCSSLFIGQLFTAMEKINEETVVAPEASTKIFGGSFFNLAVILDRHGSEKEDLDFKIGPKQQDFIKAMCSQNCVVIVSDQTVKYVIEAIWDHKTDVSDFIDKEKETYPKNFYEKWNLYRIKINDKKTHFLLFVPKEKTLPISKNFKADDVFSTIDICSVEGDSDDAKRKFVKEWVYDVTVGDDAATYDISTVVYQILNFVADSFDYITIYFTGHGSKNRTIADLTIAEMQGFLTVLAKFDRSSPHAKINILFIRSCHVGGVNQEEFLREHQKAFSLPHRFIIVLGGSDEASTRFPKKMGYDIFFEKAAALRGEESWDFVVKDFLAYCSQIPSAVGDVQAKSNIPLILLPEGLHFDAYSMKSIIRVIGNVETKVAKANKSKIDITDVRAFMVSPLFFDVPLYIFPTPVSSIDEARTIQGFLKKIFEHTPFLGDFYAAKSLMEGNLERQQAFASWIENNEEKTLAKQIVNYFDAGFWKRTLNSYEFLYPAFIPQNKKESLFFIEEVTTGDNIMKFIRESFLIFKLDQISEEKVDQNFRRTILIEKLSGVNDLLSLFFKKALVFGQFENDILTNNYYSATEKKLFETFQRNLKNHRVWPDLNLLESINWKNYKYNDPNYEEELIDLPKLNQDILKTSDLKKDLASSLPTNKDTITLEKVMIRIFGDKAKIAFVYNNKPWVCVGDKEYLSWAFVSGDPKYETEVFDVLRRLCYHKNNILVGENVVSAFFVKDVLDVRFGSYEEVEEAAETCFDLIIKDKRVNVADAFMEIGLSDDGQTMNRLNRLNALFLRRSSRLDDQFQHMITTKFLDAIKSKNKIVRNVAKKMLDIAVQTFDERAAKKIIYGLAGLMAPQYTYVFQDIFDLLIMLADKWSYKLGADISNSLSKIDVDKDVNVAAAVKKIETYMSIKKDQSSFESQYWGLKNEARDDFLTKIFNDSIDRINMNDETICIDTFKLLNQISSDVEAKLILKNVALNKDIIITQIFKYCAKHRYPIFSFLQSLIRKAKENNHSLYPFLIDKSVDKACAFLDSEESDVSECGSDILLWIINLKDVEVNKNIKKKIEDVKNKTSGYEAVKKLLDEKNIT